MIAFIDIHQSLMQRSMCNVAEVLATMQIDTRNVAEVLATRNDRAGYDHGLIVGAHNADMY